MAVSISDLLTFSTPLREIVIANADILSLSGLSFDTYLVSSWRALTTFDVLPDSISEIRISKAVEPVLSLDFSFGSAEFS